MSRRQVHIRKARWSLDSLTPKPTPPGHARPEMQRHVAMTWAPPTIARNSAKDLNSYQPAIKAQAAPRRANRRQGPASMRSSKLDSTSVPSRALPNPKLESEEQSLSYCDCPSVAAATISLLGRRWNERNIYVPPSSASAIGHQVNAARGFEYLRGRGTMREFLFPGCCGCNELGGSTSHARFATV